MKAKSIKAKTSAELASAIDTAMADGFKPSLAVVFMSAEEELDSVRKLFSAKGIQVFGSSSGSEFIDGEIETGGIAAMLMDMNPAYFRLQLVETGSATTRGIAGQIATIGKKAFRKSAFLVVSGGVSTEGDEIIEGIEMVTGQGTTIFGGLAADNFRMERTYVFTNNAFSDNGLLALILDEEKISLDGMAIGGWRPIGMERIITRSKGNIVYTIDNEPALDFVMRYAGLSSIEHENATIMISTNFQLQLQRENKHPVMRAPLQANKEDRSIAVGGSVPEGSKVRFCLLPGFEVVETVLGEFAHYKNNQPEADALLMFSCAGRQLSLGPFASEEIDGVKAIWDAPLAGFFCFGEIGKVPDGKHEYHNMTCSLALLKEK